jgi:hypothetical protein
MSDDATRSSSIVVLGLVGLTICWWGASGQANWHDQSSWLAGAVASTALAAVGTSRWLMAGLRNVRLAKRELFAELGAQGFLEPGVRTAEASERGTSTADRAAEFVASPTMTRFHRPECILVRNKPQVAGLSPREIHDRKMRECGVCVR